MSSVDKSLGGRPKPPPPPPAAPALHAVGEDVGQPADELAQVGRVAALTPPLELGADDVEAPLGEPADVGQGVLDRLAIGPHGPDPLDRDGGEPGQVGRRREVFELRIHDGRGYRDRPGAAPVRGGRAPTGRVATGIRTEGRCVL